MADSAGFAAEEESKEQVVSRLCAKREQALWLEHDEAEVRMSALEEAKEKEAEQQKLQVSCRYRTKVN